jgi:tRNA U34 5-methylaminomethyl-2-thiouridine-forming methyltransferase MnmC
MERELLLTSDGSHTIRLSGTSVTYHSIHGAIGESAHIFINAGLRYVLDRRSGRDSVVRIFEMGFGTGLNAALTLGALQGTGFSAYYRSLELYPLTLQEVTALNYPALLGDFLPGYFFSMHNAPWGEDIAIHPQFRLHKMQASLLDHDETGCFDVIYYDAFAPADQPELWTEAIFKKMFHITATGGVLVTYCAKGSVRRALQAAGYSIERLPGPAGKREILRAIKV